MTPAEKKLYDLTVALNELSPNRESHTLRVNHELHIAITKCLQEITNSQDAIKYDIRGGTDSTYHKNKDAIYFMINGTQIILLLE